MGKAIIDSHLGGGHYSVNLQYNLDRVNAMISWMEAENSKTELLIAAMNVRIFDKEIEYRAEESKEPPATFAKLYELRTIINGMKREVRVWQLQIAARDLKMAQLRGLPSQSWIGVWCADYSEELSGTVGLAEVNGVPGQHIIQPGYGGNAAYNVERDGIIQNSKGAVPEGLYWNLSLLPGWQKWKPTYRIATVTSLDVVNNTADITLRAVTSDKTPKGRTINLNARPAYAAVPVTYMTCNARAFAVGDNVLVKFRNQDLTDPVVIGFEDHPRPCGISIRLYRGDGIHVRGLYGYGTEANGYLLYSIALYDADNQWADSSATYNSDTGYWDIVLAEGVTPDPRGYWIAYSGYRMATGNYPYRFVYGSAGSPFAVNVRQAEDLVVAGRYVDIVPYGRTVSVNQPPDTTYGFYSVYNQSRTNYLNVYSSVPYVLQGALQASLGFVGGSDLDHEATVTAVLSKTLPAWPTWWEYETAQSFISAGGVQLPSAVAEEIARILDPREDWDWDAFNAQFPEALISIGPSFTANQHGFTIAPKADCYARIGLVGLSSLGL